MSRAVAAPHDEAAEHGASTALSPTFGGGRRSAGAAEHRTVGATPTSGGKDAGTLTDVAIDGAVSVVTGSRGRNASAVKKAAPRAPAPPQRKAQDFSSEAAWKRDYTASRAGGDAMCPCFGAGTLVETAQGPRPIETVRVGDLVLSRDEATGETGYQPVTEVFITPNKEVVELTVTDDGGSAETIVTTPGHPFWVKGQGWVTAAELRVSEVLMTAEQGLATLSAALSREGRRTVYNLEVEGWHTYFVGEAGAWVHNACRCGGGDGARPPNLSPAGAGRRGAFREAKRQSGIPVSQQPSRVGPNFDRRGDVQPGRTYEFDVPAEGGGTRRVTIRDDAAGHDYGLDNPQNRGSHFNDEAGNHYDY